MCSVSRLISFLEDHGRSRDACISLQVETKNHTIEKFDCSFEIICGLVIVYGQDRLSDLLDHPVALEDIEKALAIVREAASPYSGDGLLPSPSPGITTDTYADISRILRDVKYAQQVQEHLATVNPGDSACDLVHDFLAAIPHPGSILALTLNASGCRIVQKLLENSASRSDLISAIIHPEIASKILQICMDVNGNHVVQKFVDIVSGRAGECDFIIHALTGDDGVVEKLSAHSYGCRVVQRLMSKCIPSDVVPILESLCSNPETIARLSEDVFGNYVMQHAIEHGRDIDRERISLCLASLDILKLGCSKFASNVVEKSIRYHNKHPTSSSLLVTKLLINSMLMARDPVTNEPGILMLMKDKYGNYVVRAVIELIPQEFAPEVEHVRMLISENSHMLKKFTFSWHLVERLEKLSSNET